MRVSSPGSQAGTLIALRATPAAGRNARVLRVGTKMAQAYQQKKGALDNAVSALQRGPGPSARQRRPPQERGTAAPNNVAQPRVEAAPCGECGAKRVQPTPLCTSATSTWTLCRPTSFRPASRPN